MALYAITVTLSACLLFLVQPLIAKIILPWFGGTSAVWAAVLVFFQACVLGGYAYAHCLTTFLRPRVQRIVHGALLLAACALMPILPSESWRPDAVSDPTFRILLLLTVSVGLPSFLLSSTSPLLQVWFLRRGARAEPYWLFALSNLGSMLALLSFPLLLEPNFDSRVLALGWSGGFVLFAVLCGWVAWGSRADAPAPERLTATPATPPSSGQMTLWVVLAACASAMLITVSAQLSTNVAPIPLLWVIPLALYLLTFILNFASDRFYSRRSFLPWLAASLGSMTYLYIQAEGNWHIQYVIPLYLLSLFIVCMICHGEIVFRRPAVPYLTRFYLLIALGGALGGFFVAVVAPLLFDTALEFPALLVVVAALMVILQWQRRGSRLRLWLVRIVMIIGVIGLAGYLTLAEQLVREDHLAIRRNFYGVLRVRDEMTDSRLARRQLVHGTISHGYQYLDDDLRNVAGSYFSASSGVGRALQAVQAQGPVRYGVIGLGAGILSSYARKGDSVTIYEINPVVVELAEEFFEFLPRARAQGAAVDVVLGDARLTLERQPPQQFDMLIVDAFSSDAIPAHLLTNEAFALYARHLEPGGVLAVHISNRYLDLTPVVFRGARHIDREATVLTSQSDGMFDTSVWVLVTPDRTLLQHSQFLGARMYPASAAAEFAGWTDQYSSVWPILKLGRKGQ